MMLYTPDMAGSGQYGYCEHCGLPPTQAGHDGCLGTLPESVVMNACCGHGRNSAAYIQYWGGECVRGDDALHAISCMTDRTPERPPDRRYVRPRPVR